MGNVLKIESATEAKRHRGRTHSYYAEDPGTAYLLTGLDTQGRPVYYFQLEITGLRKRVFGPYAKRSTAIRLYDSVLEKVLRGYCDVLNDGREEGYVGMEHVEAPEDLKPLSL